MDNTVLEMKDFKDLADICCKKAREATRKLQEFEPTTEEFRTTLTIIQGCLALYSQSISIIMKGREVFKDQHKEEA